MASSALSPRIVLLCTLIVLVCCLHDSDAWRSRRWRFRGSRIVRAVRRIIPIRTTRLKAELGRILPRIRIGGERLRNFRLPRIRITYPRAPPESQEPDIENGPIECETPKIVTRQQWNSPVLPPRSELQLPLKAIAVYKAGDACNTEAACIVQAKSYYQEHYSYNFMIGGDGKVYEGRGWNNQSDHHIMPNKKATEYGFLLFGQQCPDENDTIWDTVSELMGCGVELGKLASDLNAETDIIWSRLEC